MTPDTLAAGLYWHRNGNLQEAARIYQAIVDREPNNADALYLLGVIALRTGNPAPAADLIGRAAALRPAQAPFHADLADALRGLGQLDRAAASCRHALSLQPDSADYHIRLGVILLAQDQAEAAVAELREALRLAPDSPHAHNNLGNALRHLGRKDEALVHFREAVRRMPGRPEPRSNLGLLLLEMGSAPEAREHLVEAARLEPQSGLAQNHLGNALFRLGRMAEARECYGRAVRLAPDLAEAYNNVAQVLQEEGKFEEALAWYEQALRREPASPRFLTNSGVTLIDLGQFDEAAARAETALRHSPHFPEARVLLGIARKWQGRHEEALACLEEALRLRPNQGSAYQGLADLHEVLGDLDAAVASLREALRCEPDRVGARAHLATLLRGRLPAEDQAALEQTLANPNLDDRSRALVHFGLGHVLDARGAYAQAAEHARLANAHHLAALRSRRQGYDREGCQKYMEHMIEAFTPAFFERVAGFGLDSAQPVFVVGLPRSGTTLTEQVLASHSRVCGAGELPLIREAFESLPRVLNSADTVWQCLPRLDRPTIQSLGEAHLERLAECSRSADRIVNKMPDNYLFLGFIATLFPRARIIHCRRGLRDVALSCWMTDFGRLYWAFDMEHIADHFAQYRQVMEHWRQVLPVEVLHVDYEEMVADLEGTARRLVAWCGLEWEPACLDFHKTRRPVNTASAAQVRRPLYSSSVGRWKNYEHLFADLFARLPS
jgi:tetratricopeptide (TPR) repeat protein